MLAVYGGSPNWHEIDAITAESPGVNIEDVTDEALNSVGFLSFDNDVRMFAIDGQHRLAGVIEAIAKGVNLTDDECSVILVAHKESTSGRQRTRRLFTTLNKTAKSVSKGDIIALDEDDVMALCVRKLVTEHAFFNGDRILITATNNIPKANHSCLTTIGNLYDILGILFSKSEFDLKKPLKELRFMRPADKELDQYYCYSVRYFESLNKHFPDLQRFFGAKNFSLIKKRTDGGNVLFRPVGLSIFTEIISTLTADYELDDAVEIAANAPQSLSESPFAGVLYDNLRDKILSNGRTVIRNLLMYQLGMDVDILSLQDKLSAALGRPGDSASILGEFDLIFDET